VKRITHSRPSPAIVVAVVALAAALAGTAVAGPEASTSDTASKALKKAKKANKNAKAAKAEVQAVFPITGADLGVVNTRTQTETVNAGQSASTTVNCLPGERVLSGGFITDVQNNDVVVEQDRKQGEGWFVQVINFSGANHTFTAEANCLTP
jgi:hypothetical protein